MKTLGNYRGYVILSLLYALGLGGYVLYDRWPRPEPMAIVQPTPTATATPAPMRVHVVGAVRQPGVYALEPASRWAEAVAAAGGMAADADQERVNLAERLQDGQQVYIPRVGTPAPPSPTPLQPIPPAEQAADPKDAGSRGADLQVAVSQGAADITAKININTASLAELDTLPGIGPVYAQRIIAYREAHGPFTEIAQITEVNGIGPVTFERIQELITVE